MLSFAQERIWFLDQLQQNKPFYNIPIALRLYGPLDIKVLEKAFSKLLHRHESLRTTFISIDGKPQIKIKSAEEVNFKLGVEQLHKQSNSVKTAISTICSQEARAPFNLTEWPLLRIRLLVINPEDHLLLITFHHVIADGWSVAIFSHELGLIYNAGLKKLPDGLVPLSIQYADFAYWQREWLQGEILKQQLNYWKNHLSDFTSLELPLDYSRPTLQTYNGQTLSFLMPIDYTKKLKQLSRQMNVTLFTMLFTIFSILLGRYSNQNDIVLGTSVAGRTLTETEGIIGLFVNTLVLRSDLSSSINFSSLLQKNQQIILNAFLHQDIPFEKLVDALKTARDPARNPLFQVMFVLQNLPENPWKFENIRVQPQEVHYDSSKFDLNFVFSEKMENLEARLEYNIDLFKEASIQRLWNHYLTLVEAVIENPEQQINQLSLLTPTEYDNIIYKWNATSADYPCTKTLHELFEDQVSKTLNQTAVIFKDQCLTYQELNAQSNQLAHYLRSLYVNHFGKELSAGALLAVMMERSFDMVVSILGILKAGGAYVPIDPDYPTLRIQYMLRDSEANVVITNAKTLAMCSKILSKLNPPPICIILEEDWQSIKENSIDNLQPMAKAEDLAYVIYTSGSTGQPKGVMNVHRAIVNRLWWMQNAYQLTDQDRILQKTSFSFDVSIWEFFWPLVSGAQLVLAEPGEQKDSHAIVRRIIHEEISTIHFVPSMLAAFLTERDVGQCTSLKRVICSGEALSYSLQQLFFQKLSAKLYNLYGPTEAAIDVSAWECKAISEYTSVPIGKPISNIELYVLNRYLQPVPVGVIGELYIGGVGLARGYLHQPKLTAERFIVHPFKKDKVSRLYKSGDLVFWRDDGNLEYVGRNDDQIKIRGFRIELGEIIAQLETYPGIHQAVVLSKKINEDAYLIGYLVSENKIQLDIKKIRAFLQKKLPDYMVPHALTQIESIPLTPSGKVDKKALLEMEVNQINQLVHFVPAKNAEEQSLINIWAEVLKIDPATIGINDNFFDLGGHSLLATQVVSRIRSLFQVELPLVELFKNPQISSLINEINRRISDNEEYSLPALTVKQDQELPLLSFSQERLWFLDQLQPMQATYNISIALRLQGIVQVDILEKSLRQLIDRHKSLRTIFINQKDITLQMIVPIEKINFNLVPINLDSNANALDQIEEVISFSANTPFNLIEEPLFRIKLWKIQKNDYALLIVFHHIIADGWSIGIFSREFSLIYNAISNNKLTNLEELSFTYMDFSLWQRNLLENEIIKEQLKYWCQKLQGIKPFNLPADYPRPPKQTHHGDWIPISISKEISIQLNHFCKENNVTLFTLLYSIFVLLLYRYSYEEDISIGTTIAGRRLKETENIIGLFVNTIVLRSNLSEKTSFLEFLLNNHKMILSSFSNQDIAFEKIVETIKIERDPAYNPLFQIMFVLQNLPENPWQLNNIDVTLFNITSKHSKFDLSLILTEAGEKEIYGVIEYNTDLFKKETILRLRNHLLTLMATILVNPYGKVDELSILTKDEQHKILVKWNETSTIQAFKTLHELYENQTAKNPHAIAVEFEGQQLTYKQLNEKANQLAYVIRRSYKERFGIEMPDNTFYCICMERSIEMVIGILAIIKANGAYVPLDANYPTDRLLFILEDTECKLVLTQEHLLDKMPFLISDQREVFCLDGDWDFIANAPSDNLHIGADAENLAYVIYTSGSTGKPKGVLIQHKGIVNSIKAQIATFPILESSRVLQFASFSFDLATWEIFGTLLAGGTLIVCPPEKLLPGEKLADTLINQKISVVFLTPTVLSYLPSKPYPELKTIATGAESISAGVLKEWCKHYRCLNAYGPTEISVCVTMYICKADDYNYLIGKPIANMQVYVLDHLLQPVPIGVPGELYIGGIGLSLGYLNRVEATESAFIQNPFSKDKSSRLYKTGDIVRWRSDGNIEYIGRNDEQIKIRGYRIELGEIENRLLAYPAVKNAVVIFKSKNSDKYLIAFLVLKNNHKINETELNNFMAQQLPNYMIPHAYAVIKSLPRTPSGKIDKQSLILQELNFTTNLTHYTAPRTPEEKILVEIWANLLKLEATSIGIHDNFFKLGGHSLLAIQLISRIRNFLQVDLNIIDLFENPTITQQITLLNVKRNGNHAQKHLQIVPQPDNTNKVLSFTQERLWFLDQLQPNHSFYNIHIVLNLHGKLNITALQNAFSKLVERHESLRSIFPTINGKATIIISDIDKDKSPLFIGKKKSVFTSEELKFYIQAEVKTPFDLSLGPLYRFKLLNINDDEYLLLIILHHIIADGWSITILFRELSLYYDAFITNSIAQLPPLIIQYYDFSYGHKNWMTGEVLDLQLQYWKNKLSDFEPLRLPLDYPRPSLQTYNGQKMLINISKSKTPQLKHFCQRVNTTLFTVLFSVFSVALKVYSGQEDIIIGAPIAGRQWLETEENIGCFINNLVLRSDLTGSPNFYTIVQRNHKMILDAHIFQDLPFEKLVDALNLQKDPSQNPIFQIMFILQNLPRNPLKFKNIKIKNLSSNYVNSKFDLTLAFEETKNKISGAIEYNTDLFKETTIAQFKDHFLFLLEQLIEFPELSINNLSMLREEEKQRILFKWNNTHANFPKEKTLIQLFEEQVFKTPEKIAVIFKDESLTYQKLNQISNQLAITLRSHYLTNKGIEMTADQPIPIIAERSLEMVIGILAILKAGGAYVPIDPYYPLERIKYIFHDISIDFFLLQDKLTHQLHGTINELLKFAVCIPITAKQSVISNYDNLSSIAKPNNLAYVIYTSGTTGTPKGVLIDHCGVFNRLIWMQKAYKINGNAKILHKTPFTFDVSVWELFLPLIVGAQLIICEPEGHKDPQYLLAIIKKYQINIIHFVPSMLEVFLHTLTQNTNLDSLKHIFCSGEALPTRITKEFLSLFPFINIHNLYGPTEASIDVSYWKCKQTDYLQNLIAPIGKPIDNIKLYVLDKSLNVLPIGIVGELHIGGVGLARGYLNMENVTREKFIPNPFSEDKIELLYKTGDLVSLRSDGNLNYIGRNDLQVKINGYRIELNEIQSILINHKEIKQSIVAVKEREERKFLVAYYVARNPIKTEKLRKYLSSRLPDYMVPSVYMHLKSFPLTIHGKLDLKELPEPELIFEEQYYPPTSINEKQLQEIWQQVLGLEKISIKDDFFRIGGDSILSIQLVSRLQYYGFYVNAKDIFLNRTIEKLAQFVLKSQLHFITAEQGVLTGSFDLLPIQLWFFECHYAKSHHWNQSFLIKVPNLDIQRLTLAINHLVEYHDILRVRFFKKKNEYKQIYRKIYEIPEIKVIDRSSLSETQYQLILTDLQSNFDVKKGYLWNIAYISNYPDNSNRIYFSLHHLIVDTVTWQILVNDLHGLYEFSDLPKKTSSYRQWVSVIKSYAQENKDEIKYWTKVIRMQINYDKIINVADVSKINKACFKLDQTKTKFLIQQANFAYHTQINDLLLSALAYALKDLFKMNENFITLEGHGREYLLDNIEINRTAGWFTTIFPLKLAIKQDLPKTIKSVKETLREIPHKGVGYGALKYYEESKLLRNHVLPKILFNFLGQFIDKDQFWNMVPEFSGVNIASENKDYYLLTITGLIVTNELTFTITSPSASLVVSNLCRLFQKYLEDIIYHCKMSLEKNKIEFTESDFSYATSEADLKEFPLTEIEWMYKVILSDNSLLHLNPIVNINTQGNKTPLFCFHDISGTAFVYVLLSHHLGADQPLYAVQDPTIKQKSSFNSIKDMAQCYLQAIKKIQPNPPYNLCGWSMGGMIAYELAQQLIAQGDKVNQLILIDSITGKRFNTTTEDELRKEVDKRLMRIRANLILSGSHLAKFKKWRTQTLNAVVSRQNMVWDYTPKLYQGEQITLFKASEKMVGFLDLVTPSKANGWQRYCPHLKIYPVPGNHRSMMSEPNIELLAVQIKKILD